MIKLVQSFVLFVRLYLLRRRQFDSLPLRRFFQKNYDIEVGLYSYGCFDRWRMPGPMRVGRYCSIANTVRSALDNHLIEALTTHPILYEKAFGVVDEDMERPDPLVIEDDVWIGHNVIILAGCKHIGRGAVIGAGAIVTKNVEPYTVVAGNPARKLRDRFPPDLQAALEASRWWDRDLAFFRKRVLENPDGLYRPGPADILALCSDGDVGGVADERA